MMTMMMMMMMMILALKTTTGLAAYIKKIEYGSPQIKASNIQLENYKHDYISDLRSQIIIDDKIIKNTDCKENMEICSF